MQDIKIPYTKPSITNLELDMVRQAQCHSDPYHFVDKFEQAWASYTGMKYAIATSSCTGALTLGYAAQGLAPGDNVVMADSNWIATAAPLIHLGVQIRVVDIDPLSWCLHPKAAQPAIDANTKGLVVTHLYGNLADMRGLIDLGLPVIEDAAEAIGSRYHDQLAGTMGLWGAYSFHHTKTISTGEGGMFVTNDENVYHRARQLSNHGRSTRRDTLHIDTVGFKFKMTNMQAAQGLAQLSRLPELLARKREIFEYYQCHVDSTVELNTIPKGCKHGHWLPVAVFAQNLGCERILGEFRHNHIDTRQFFSPLSQTGFVHEIGTVRYAYQMPQRAVNLPSYHDITEHELERVIQVVNRLARESDRS